MKPYVIVSDLHCHNWSAFASTDADGVNNRLRFILNELERAGDMLLKAGGNHMIVAGDVFHQRGSIHPAVFNPTVDAFQRLIQKGIQISAIPGNHDLATKETTELGNAIQTLSKLDGFEVLTEVDCCTGQPDIMMVPWQATLDGLRERIAEIKDAFDVESMDLVMHAGINGVIMGMPDHALDAAEVAGWGFKRVFAGHYHNHKDLGSGVYSIGATTHQTWGDIGTKAGFLIVHEDKVVYSASHAPNFVEINETTDETDIPLVVDGNYVRVRGMKVADTEIKALKKELEGFGCRGLTFQVVREATTSRPARAKGLTIEASVDSFIADLKHPEEETIKTECADILAGVRALAA